MVLHILISRNRRKNVSKQAKSEIRFSSPASITSSKSLVYKGLGLFFLSNYPKTTQNFKFPHSTSIILCYSFLNRVFLCASCVPYLKRRSAMKYLKYLYILSIIILVSSIILLLFRLASYIDALTY